MYSLEEALNLFIIDTNDGCYKMNNNNNNSKPNRNTILLNAF